MIPLRLELYNFLAYRERQTLTLEGVHLACLVGANGAGKSSLLDAMTWVIWGNARAGRDADLIYHKALEAAVTLTFRHEGQIYRVERTLVRRGQTTTGTLALFGVGEDGTLNDISEAGKNNTQRRINRLLQLDYQTFIHSAYLQQGKSGAFTLAMPAQRKKILSDILGLEQWEAYEERAKAQVKALEGKLQWYQTSLENLHRELAQEPQLRAALQSAEAAYQHAHSALEVADNAVREVEDAPAALRMAQDNRASAQQRITTLDAQRAIVEEKRTAQARKLADAEALLAERADIEAGYGTLQQARDNNAALAEKLDAVRRLEGEMAVIESQVASERGRLDGEQRELSKQAAKLRKKIESAADDAESVAITAQISALEGLAAERDGLQGQINQWVEQDVGYKSGLTRLHTDMKDLKQRMDDLTALDSAICPLCGQDLTVAHREAMIADLAAQGKQMRADYDADYSAWDAVKLQRAQAEARFQQIKEEVAELPRLHSRRGTLENQRKAASQDQQALAEAEQRLLDVTAMLETEGYAVELREQLHALGAEKAALGYDESAYSETRNVIQQYREYETRWNALQVVEQSLSTLHDTLAAYEGQIAQLQDSLTAENARVHELAAMIEHQTARAGIFQQRLTQRNQLHSDERKAFEAKTVAQQSLSSMDELRKKRDGYESERNKTAAEKTIYDELVKAFGKKGVPAMIIETVLPELERLANNLLARMTDGRMWLRFIVQRENVKGNVSETLDIEIADELGTRRYELYSGGEAFRIDFAVRVALSKLLARRAGAHLETLFVDEGFGTQDTDGRSKIIEAINAVRDDFEMILVITHIEELKDAFPVHINVEKTPQGSVVWVS